MHELIKYIYALMDVFIQSDLQLHSGYTFFNQYVCSLGIEPTTFCAADAMLYHWATEEYIPWMQYQSLCKKKN